MLLCYLLLQKAAAAPKVKEEKKDAPVKKEVSAKPKEAKPAVKKEDKKDEKAKQEKPVKKEAAAKKETKEGDKPAREKKVFDMPGQTKETPSEVGLGQQAMCIAWARMACNAHASMWHAFLSCTRLRPSDSILCCMLQTDPLRKFYTSLLEQRPDSEMAKKWCGMGMLTGRACLLGQRTRQELHQPLFAAAQSQLAQSPDTQAHHCVMIVIYVCMHRASCSPQVPAARPAGEGRCRGPGERAGS